MITTKEKPKIEKDLNGNLPHRNHKNYKINGGIPSGDHKNNDGIDELKNADKNGDLYDDVDDDGYLHGYNKISSGCGEKIQLEDPDKKELLVRVLLGGGSVVMVIEELQLKQLKLLQA